ncbi:SPFH domain-containing protein [Luteimonas sp. FXH3W]|uniref:SPFH domain-containing protein n=1 Tax=Aquilutibacter rugosus TaxID=3115820 RepID=A0ABU7V0A5_9GAMM
MESKPRDNRLVLNRETPARTFSGYILLVVLLAVAAASIYGIVSLSQFDGDPSLAQVVPRILGPVLVALIAKGFFLLQPNQAAAIQLFGAYQGTDRNTGLRWTWPWLSKRKISVRIHNVTSERLKVNDKRGNPVEIAANVVWRVDDTAQALFDVDDYREFVNIQIESAVRAIGSKYPYDDFDHDELTLRGDGDHVANEMAAELQERVRAAGVIIDETRLTHLAYAQEIAGAMLRRQQAQAVVAARHTLVEGAVGMVEMALEQLSAKNVVELDDERRAAMVSNLMVVLCGERDTQPIVNAGSLYQ